MSVSELNTRTPVGTYVASRVRPIPVSVSTASPAPTAGATTHDGKYIP